MKDTLMVHYVSSNLSNNAARFSHNSIQGHAHSLLGVQYHADKTNLRWAMGVGCLMDPNSPAARYGAGNVLKRPLLGCGMLLSEEGNTLVISDMHIPYQHKDAFDFLEALADKYEVTSVLNVGDLIDHHAGSYHESEPDALSPEEEYLVSKRDCAILQEIFPDMIITVGNHDKIPARKLKSCGLPASMLSDYNLMYNLDDGWQWVDEYFFDSRGAKPIVAPMVLNKRGRWDKKLT